MYLHPKYKFELILTRVNIIKFYVRETEIKILKENEIQSRHNAVFKVLIGRRRTGKTALVIRDFEGNGIDMIALNEFDNTGVVAEIKRNPKKIDLAYLQEKMRALPPQAFGKYTLTPVGLSIEDM